MQMAQPLEPDLALRSEWTQQITAHGARFIESLPAAPAFVSAQAEGKGGLSSPISENPEPAPKLLEVLSQHIATAGLRLGAPGFLGFIPISTLYPAALGDYLAATLNPYAGNFFASPGAVRLEHLLTRWMANLVGYPASSAGDLTSGGSLANLSAIVSAREARALKSSQYERAIVYLTSQTHHSVAKALRIAGLGECQRRLIPLDPAYRMQPAALNLAIKQDKASGLLPWLIVASAGSTDVGAVDPLLEITAIAQQHQLWLHVDAAYGGFFALCEPGRKVLTGMEHSDSLTLDPHKALFMPCGSGAVLVREANYLRNAYSYDASYMQDRASLASLDEISPSELSPELTRPFRGLRLWLSLKMIGLKPFRAALEEKLLLARYFYEQISAFERIEVGPPPDLSVVVFRWIPPSGDADEYNRRLLRSIQRDGRIFISSTSLDGRFWLRLAILCVTTHREHIDLALQIFREVSA